jgi:hypothetical protein
MLEVTHMERPSSPLVFCGGHVARSLVFCVVFCRSVFHLLFLCCLSFFDLRILISSLVSFRCLIRSRNRLPFANTRVRVFSFWGIFFLSSSYVFSNQCCQCLREHMGSAPVFGRVRVTHRFNFLCFAFCLVCFRPVSCVSNITSVSWLSILDCQSNSSVLLAMINYRSYISFNISRFPLLIFLTLYNCFVFY